MAVDAAKVEHVIKLRLAYDKVNAAVRAADDPDAINKVSKAAGFWLESENELNGEEFIAYMDGWRARRTNQ